jgi:hypothetical protein
MKISPLNDKICQYILICLLAYNLFNNSVSSLHYIQSNNCNVLNNQENVKGSNHSLFSCHILKLAWTDMLYMHNCHIYT